MVGEHSATNMADGCLHGCFLILCGIPASGKSSFAEKLREKEWKINEEPVHFFYISYDQLITADLPVDKASSIWKQTREKIRMDLEQVLLKKPWEEEKNYNFREFFEDWCLFHANFK